MWAPPPILHQPLIFGTGYPSNMTCQENYYCWDGPIESWNFLTLLFTFRLNSSTLAFKEPTWDSWWSSLGSPDDKILFINTAPKIKSLSLLSTFLLFRLDYYQQLVWFLIIIIKAFSGLYIWVIYVNFVSSCQSFFD